MKNSPVSMIGGIGLTTWVVVEVGTDHADDLVDVGVLDAQDSNTLSQAHTQQPIDVLGVEDADVDEVVSVVRANCTSRTQVVNPMPPIMEPGEFFMPYPLEVEVGGATVFVLPVERFERL